MSNFQPEDEAILIEDIIQKLVISGYDTIGSRLGLVQFALPVTGTEAKGYVYGVQLDGMGRPRIQDLAEFVATKMVDYAIPKVERDAAKEYLNKTGSSSKILELQTKAKGLFTDLKKTGEGGEMLLYILTQEFLKFPQLLAKMPLKTSGKVHYQGVDGIHANYNSKTGQLELFWGESKMYASITSALSECFKSLKGYLLDSYGAGSTQERDLELISGNIANSINDTGMEDILVRYFDKDDDLSNALVYKGVCFVGFDADIYPVTPNQGNTFKEIELEINSQIQAWLENVGSAITKHTDLETFEIHVFLIPFPSVQDFRDHFLKYVK